MPAATSTKPEMAGAKRKSPSVKNGHSKDAKKAKIESPRKLASRTKSKPSSVKKLGEYRDEDADDSDDSDLDGGVPLNSKDGDSDLEEEEENNQEPTPTANDGIHPERAKAVVANSKLSSHTPDSYTNHK